MNIIERIYSIIVAGILIFGCWFIYQGMIDFIECQTLNSYFSTEEVYNINDDKLLVKSQLKCEGKIYQVGDVITSAQYNNCKGGN